MIINSEFLFEKSPIYLEKVVKIDTQFFSFRKKRKNPLPYFF